MPYTINVGARSFFVTAIAWVFIAFGALASASALLQNANLASLLPALQAGTAQGSLPWLGSLLMDYLPWTLGAVLALSLATLASAVGLLFRLDWARRVFIALLIVAIVANVAGLWLQHELVQSVVSATLSSGPFPEQALGVFGGFVTAARVMGALMTLVACLALAWIIRALMSPAVRQEFV